MTYYQSMGKNGRAKRTNKQRPKKGLEIPVAKPGEFMRNLKGGEAFASPPEGSEAILV